MRITMVKKIKADGSPCRKCADVEERLKSSGLWNGIDEVVVADEREPDSEGMRLARQYGVDAAPFFIVEDGPGQVRIYTVFMRLLREVLDKPVSESDEAAEILDRHPGLDLL
ncbi:MAG: hypothetical protein HYY48_04690 [Gammaproteobacteria bacterium]|nr:hypothetical protein [Gammaproteobacteria bacterium]